MSASNRFTPCRKHAGEQRGFETRHRIRELIDLTLSAYLGYSSDYSFTLRGGPIRDLPSLHRNHHSFRRALQRHRILAPSSYPPSSSSPPSPFPKSKESATPASDEQLASDTHSMVDGVAQLRRRRSARCTRAACARRCSATSPCCYLCGDV